MASIISVNYEILHKSIEGYSYILEIHENTSIELQRLRIELQLLEMQDTFQLKEDLHLKVRKECYIGLLIVFLVRLRSEIL